MSFKIEYLKAYKDIIRLFIKYGRSDLIKDYALAKGEEIGPQSAPAKAKELAADLERMGPTYVKLGQLLSTRPDLLPAPYIEALSRLQDNLEPFSFAEVEKIVSEELGVRISKAFASFDSTPIASASLGQVHRATLRDGKAVAVKVQRPGIGERIEKDLSALSEIAGFLDNHTEAGRRFHFSEILEEFRKSLAQELDYRQEARNLITLGENLKLLDRIIVPAPVVDFTTSRVLTMNYIEGKKITSLSPLALIDLNGAALAEQLFRAYLRQILVDGFFHADPHPGNVFVTDDGRIALIDLGMVARITPRMQGKILQLLLVISEGQSDDAAAQTLKIGEPSEDFNEAEFRRWVGSIVGEHQSSNLKQVQMGKIVLEITRTSSACGIRVPPELAMLGKTLLNLDLVARILNPEFEPNAAIRRNAAEIMRERMTRSLSPGTVFSSLLEAKDFLEKLPRRVNKILDLVANNEMQVKVDTIDEKLLMEGLQKIANRITLGLVLAALIVGAAMLMNVETSFRLLGYPGFAILFFVAAASGGVVLVFNILFYDDKRRKKLR
jgi:predicted unusual protein kinase regulating ubiquinone biosynthesis (AarF/ABC1/UbiB family)